MEESGDDGPCPLMAAIVMSGKVISRYTTGSKVSTFQPVSTLRIPELKRVS